MEIIGVLIAYLTGAIPTAVWLGQVSHGVDIRDFGSGNSGATNSFRILGRKIGIQVLIIDIIKGAVAVNLSYYFAYSIPGTENFTSFQLVLGLFAILGHIFPVYAGFKGGKGIATLLGVLLAIHPDAALYCIIIFLLVFLLTRYVSLGSMLAALAFPFIVIIVFQERAESLAIFSMFISIMVLITHQKNIERLLKRKESRAILYRFKRRINGTQRKVQSQN